LGDRFSGWLSIYAAGAGEFDAKALVKKARDYFTNFNIPEEIATDGGPQMTSSVFQQSLKAWGIRHRLSSAYLPHSNCRAEIAVKSGKRLLRDNVGPGGDLDTDRFMRAVLQYRNTPMQDSMRSPAQMVFGRHMRDFLPSLPHKYEATKDWSVTQEYRERTLAKKRERDDQKWRERTRDLDDLEVGTPVAIQNQTGNNPTKWDKTGIILENKPNSQVLIRVDGSRRVTMRNRRFVRLLDPALRNMQGPRSLMKEPVKKSPQPQSVQVQKPPPAQKKHVREAPPVRHDDVQEGGDLQGHHDDADQDQEVHHADDDAVPVQEGGGGGAIHVPADKGLVVHEGDAQDGGQDRPRRSPKPNPKYSPEVYDLSYVGVRKRSRKSIRRAER
jgi:hypothetical protein